MLLLNHRQFGIYFETQESNIPIADETAQCNPMT